jgi:RNA polymerase sigma factor (sigma-70 family)
MFVEGAMPTFRTEEDVEILFRETAGALFNYAVKMTNDEFLADDMVSTVFANIVRTLPVEMNSPKKYLFRSVRNAIVDWFRKRSREQDDEVLDEECMAKDVSEFHDLNEAVRALPRLQSEIVFLIYWGELSDDEVAAELKLSKGEVALTYASAIRTLRAQFADLPEEFHAEQRS